MTTLAQSQNWLDTSLYPFQHNYLSLEAGTMHYVDEGQGPVILFVHGTPTWSFLYRDFIKELSKNHRCIAVDHIGFGLSDKPQSFAGTPQLHAKNLSEFINKMNLKDITLVVHDFGGPIGLAAGIENHQRIKRIVLFNTWLWATKDDKGAQKIDRILHSWLGNFLYLNTNFSPNVLLKMAFHDKRKLSKTIHHQYKKPFPNKKSRFGLLNIGKALIGSSDWYEEQWNQLDKLRDKQWLILWGTEDTFISMEYLAQWKQRLPNAKVLQLHCGHFVQEEETERAIDEIAAFMEK